MTNPDESPGPEYVPAAEAIRMLGIHLQSLYAYVSRGWIRSIKQKGQRERLYSVEDIERLRIRSKARLGHGAIAAEAMNWGAPVIPTMITEITSRGPRYRNHHAVDLARSGRSFESVAELLWSGILHEEPLRWEVERLPPSVSQMALSTAVQSAGQLLEVFASFTLALGMARGSIEERMRSGTTLPAARHVLQTFVGCFGYASSGRFEPMNTGDSVAEGLARACGVAPTTANLEALQAILILLADHELSPGAFTARLAASSGAPLSTCIVAGICPTTGSLTGRLYDRVEDLLRGEDTGAQLLGTVSSMCERGVTPPGFEHPLYPKGDPRGRYLIELSRRLFAPTKRLTAIYNLVEEAESRLNLHARQELAVVTLAIAIGLPRGCCGALFTLSRTAGWVAHVLEQRLSTGLLRARGAFVRA